MLVKGAPDYRNESRTAYPMKYSYCLFVITTSIFSWSQVVYLSVFFTFASLALGWLFDPQNADEIFRNAK